MKNIGPILLSSILSAVLAIAGYRFFVQQPQVIVSNEGVPSAKYIALEEKVKEEVLSNIKPRTFLSTSPTNFTAAAKRVTPSVVNIKAMEKGSAAWWGNEGYESSTGSGVIISEDGYIITNLHVIEDGDEYEISLDNRKEYKAEYRFGCVENRYR